MCKWIRCYFFPSRHVDDRISCEKKRKFQLDSIDCRKCASTLGTYLSHHHQHTNEKEKKQQQYWCRFLSSFFSLLILFQARINTKKHSQTVLFSFRNCMCIGRNHASITCSEHYNNICILYTDIWISIRAAHSHKWNKNKHTRNFIETEGDNAAESKIEKTRAKKTPIEQFARSKKYIFTRAHTLIQKSSDMNRTFNWKAQVFDTPSEQKK